MPPATRHIAVLLDGACTPGARLVRMLADAEAIAADGGMRHAAPLGFRGERRPILWMGDFDSASSEEIESGRNVPRRGFPVAKDATDGELAVRHALSLKPDRLTIVGAFGGPRADHALAALMLGLSVAERAEVILTDGEQWGFPLLPDRPLELRPDAGRTVSVVPVSDLTSLSLSGVRWPLDRHDVPFGSTLTLSNEALGGAMEARLAAGRAVLLEGPGDEPPSRSGQGPAGPDRGTIRARVAGAR